MGYICFKCREEIGGGINELRFHLTHSHAMYGSKHNFQCLQDGCMRTYSDYSSFRRHLIREHSECSNTSATNSKILHKDEMETSIDILNECNNQLSDDKVRICSLILYQIKINLEFPVPLLC